MSRGKENKIEISGKERNSISSAKHVLINEPEWWSSNSKGVEMQIFKDYFSTIILGQANYENKVASLWYGHLLNINGKRVR